jgi:hypothetical protein
MKEEDKQRLVNLRQHCHDANLFEATDNWEHLTTSHNIVVHRLSDSETTDSGIPMYRARSIVEKCSIDEFLSVMATNNTDIRHKWDLPLLNLKDIEVNGDEKVVHVTFKCKE